MYENKITLTLHKFLDSEAFKAVFIPSHGDFYGLSVVTLRDIQKNRVRRLRLQDAGGRATQEAKAEKCCYRISKAVLDQIFMQR